MHVLMALVWVLCIQSTRSDEHNALNYEYQIESRIIMSRKLTFVFDEKDLLKSQVPNGDLSKIELSLSEAVKMAHEFFWRKMHKDLIGEIPEKIDKKKLCLESVCLVLRDDNNAYYRVNYTYTSMGPTGISIPVFLDKTIPHYIVQERTAQPKHRDKPPANIDKKTNK